MMLLMGTQGVSDAYERVIIKNYVWRAVKYFFSDNAPSLGPINN